MNLLAFFISALLLLGYLTLMRIDPTWGLFYPRGGMLMLGVSLAIANLGIWLAAHSQMSLSTRFQIAVAGWIWLAVQGGSLAYLYSQSGAA